MNVPFIPGATTSLTATTTSAPVAISPSAVTLCLKNAGTETVFVRWSNVSPTAVVTDYPILAGHAETITVRDGNNYLAAITATGTSLLYVTSGLGY